MEKEINGTLNYLDVKIIKNEENQLEAMIHKKPSANTDIIHAKCKTPHAYKLASLRAYINRAILICSNTKLLKEEIIKIEEIVQKLFKK